MALEGHLKPEVWKDLFSLAKPRVVMLHLVTTACAMLLASHAFPDGSIFFYTLFGGALVAGSANALNCYLDRDVDRMMLRTRNRPLAAGRLSPFQAFVFALITGFSGLIILSRFVNPTIAILSAAALIYYVLIYTWWLKRRTAWSSILGSGAGAFPPLIGWMAITGRIEAVPFLLFGIIVLWTPPHFWSIAVYRHLDYERVGLGAMPTRHIGLWVSIFSLALIALSILLAPLARLHNLYLGSALALGLVLGARSAGLQLHQSAAAARRLYLYSIVYLTLLFAAMVADRLIFR